MLSCVLGPRPSAEKATLLHLGSQATQQTHDAPAPSAPGPSAATLPPHSGPKFQQQERCITASWARGQAILTLARRPLTPSQAAGARLHRLWALGMAADTLTRCAFGPATGDSNNTLLHLWAKGPATGTLLHHALGPRATAVDAIRRCT